TRPDPRARRPSSSAAICRSSLAADTALFSTDGASSSTKNTISVSPEWPRRIWSPCASTRSLYFSPLTNVPNRDCLSRMMQVPFSILISAWTREMSAPGSRRSVSLRRPMVNKALSMFTMRRPSASVTTRRGAGTSGIEDGIISRNLTAGPPGTYSPCRSSTGERMKHAKSDLWQGTLDLLILRTLASGDMHGWGISQRLQQISQDVLQVNQGSLYPALYRLDAQGAVR